MSINSGYKRVGYFGEAKTSITGLQKKLTAKIRTFDKYGERFTELVCIVFIEEAKKRLEESGYNVKRLLNNISYRKYGNGKFRIYIKQNKEKEIMYFLEFGTGLVGLQDPHPEAQKMNWEYLIHPDIIVSNPFSRETNSVGDYVGRRGWFYLDETGKLKFTSGLKAVGYLYNTIRNMDEIFAEAKRRMEFEYGNN